MANTIRIEAIHPYKIQNTAGDIIEILKKTYGSIYDVVTVVALGLAVCTIIYIGIKYITSAGDAKKTSEAKSSIVKTMIGIVIITTTYGIITLGGALGALIEKNISSTYTQSTASPHPSPTTSPTTTPTNEENPESPDSNTDLDELWEALNSAFPASPSPSASPQ